MRRIVEFCTNNTHVGLDIVMARLSLRPDIDTLEYGCLGNCGMCYTEPFALVDGKMVEAESADELYEKIIVAIEEEEEDPFADLPLD